MPAIPIRVRLSSDDEASAAGQCAVAFEGGRIVGGNVEPADTTRSPEQCARCLDGHIGKKRQAAPAMVLDRAGRLGDAAVAWERLPSGL
jgi:hypothetical protein